MPQKIHCEFGIHSWKLIKSAYTCVFEKQEINANEKFELFNYNANNNSHVTVVYFNYCKLSKFPQGLTTIFPNMKGLVVCNSDLPYMAREDLIEYKRLKELHIDSNQIQLFSENLLVDMKELESFSMYGNKILFLESNFLDNLDKLKYANLKKCCYINLVYDTIDPQLSEVTLEELKKQLLKKFQQSPWKSYAENRVNQNEMFQDLKEIMMKENLKDFKVTVGTKEFKSHKFVLAACSPVFAEMFENNIDAGSLNLVDISPATFQEIHNFMYSNEFPKSDEINFVHLLIASEKLKVKKLAYFAATKLLNQITVENAFEFITLGHKYGYEDLKKKSFEKVKEIFGDEQIDERLLNKPEKLKQLIDLKKEEIRYMNDLKQKFKNIINEN